jgi:hypothetical protein
VGLGQSFLDFSANVNSSRLFQTFILQGPVFLLFFRRALLVRGLRPAKKFETCLSLGENALLPSQRAFGTTRLTMVKTRFNGKKTLPAVSLVSDSFMHSRRNFNTRHVPACKNGRRA